MALNRVSGSGPIQIRESCQPERIAEPAATGALEVEQELRMARQLEAGVDRPQTGQCLFRTRSQTVVAFVRRGKPSMCLGDEVQLARHPPAAVVPMRQH